MRIFAVLIVMLALTNQGSAATTRQPSGWVKVESESQVIQLVGGKTLVNEAGWQFRFKSDGTYDYRPSTKKKWSNTRTYSIRGGIIFGGSEQYMLYHKNGRLVGYQHSNGNYVRLW